MSNDLCPCKDRSKKKTYLIGGGGDTKQNESVGGNKCFIGHFRVYCFWKEYSPPFF